MTDFTGMTKTSCAAKCGAERCVISEVGYCAHPLQGGLQLAMKNQASLARYAAACKALGVRDVNTIPERLTP
jgi:hypothetical protein